MDKKEIIKDLRDLYDRNKLESIDEDVILNTLIFLGFDIGTL